MLGKCKRIVGKICKIIAGIVILFVVLDFIPIKMATTMSGLKSLKGKHSVLYIAEYAQVTDSIWHVVGDENGYFKDTHRKIKTEYIADNSEGTDPFEKLNSSYTEILRGYSANKVVFVGESLGMRDSNVEEIKTENSSC